MNNVFTVLLTTVLFGHVWCLHADQVSKFDWKKEFVGDIFDCTIKDKKAFVVSRDGVIACLDQKGDFIWRRVFEDSFHGKINKVLWLQNDIIIFLNFGERIINLDYETGLVNHEIGLSTHDGPLNFDVSVSSDNRVLVVLSNNILVRMNPGLTVFWSKNLTSDYVSYPGLFLTSRNDVVLLATHADGKHSVLVMSSGSGEVSTKMDWNIASSLSSCVKDSSYVLLCALKSGVIALRFSESFQTEEVSGIETPLREYNSYPFLCSKGKCRRWESHFWIENVVAFSDLSDTYLNINNYIVNGTNQPLFRVDLPRDIRRVIIYKQLDSFVLIFTEDRTLLFYSCKQSPRLLYRREESLAHIIASDLVDYMAPTLHFSSVFEHLLHLIDTPLHKFNLFKMILCCTRFGTVFGLSSKDGRITWKLGANCSKILAFNSTSVQLVMDDGLLEINPINGKVLSSAKFSMDITHVFRDFRSEKIFYIDAETSVSFVPPYEKCSSEPLYVYIQNGSILNGYRVPCSGRLIPSWRVSFGLQSIISIASRRRGKFQSHGVVLNNRSVLYKYLNPNMIAVSTQDHNDICLHFIDAVTGSVLYSTMHRKVYGPHLVVMAEHWVAYTYKNLGSRRTEVVVVGLFEGTEQRNPSLFSSFDFITPLVITRTYVFPKGISALGVSQTKQSITDRSLLIATSDGSIYELPWLFFDPRRPVGQDLLYEEGLIPYSPELPSSFRSIVNYYKSCLRTKTIHSVAAGLESTSIIFAHGLDLFSTRITPSRSFDTLKDDFDRNFIAYIVIGLIVFTIISRVAAKRYQVKQAWK